MSLRFPKINSPVLLGVILLFSLFFGSFLPVQIKTFLYSISLSLKELLIFALPFFIFSFVLSTVIKLQNRALQFAILLVPMVIASNFFSTWIAYYFGKTLLSFSSTTFVLALQNGGLAPMWNFALPHLVSNDLALLLGFVLGVFFLVRFSRLGSLISENMLTGTYFALNRFFIPCMPIFILGFTLKLQHDEVLLELTKNYFYVFIVIATTLFSYILISYLAISQFSLQSVLTRLRNMFPAFVTGFSTMSSAAAMPLTIQGTEKNTSRPELAQSIIPATVNIHLVGDCFAIPILAIAVMQSFSMPVPSLEGYFMFSVYFVMAKFAVAAVPGGGILVMLPILEQHLHFSAPMLSWITTLYIIFDSVITSANVLGNGSFALYFTKVFSLFGPKTRDYSSSDTL